MKKIDISIVPSDSGGTIESWRRQLNAVRPHSSLGNLTPAEFNKATEPHDCPSQANRF
jgi:Integrase core domain